MKRLALMLCMLACFAASGCGIQQKQPPELPAEQEQIKDPEAPAGQEPAAAPAESEPEPTAEDFVRVADCIPDILVDLRYATADNFTG